MNEADEDFLDRICSGEDACSDQDDDIVYRLGNQKFGVATVTPPSSASHQWFTLMRYTSHEDNSLKLPFMLQVRYQR